MSALSEIGRRYSADLHGGAVAFTANAEGIESANVCGYQQITVIPNNSIFTPTFRDVTKGGFKLSQIQPLHQDGAEFGTTGSRRCNGAIKINKINSDGNYTETYSYYSTPAKLGWYSNDEVKIEGENDVNLNDGEAILVNNMYKQMPVLFRVSGEVDLVCKNVVPPQNSLFGNSTPVAIKLSEVVVLHQDGAVFGTSGSRRCNGAVKINKISSDGNYTETYSYYSTPAKLGWYKNDDTKIEGDNDVTLEAGEAFLINNLYKQMPVIVSLPSPMK